MTNSPVRITRDQPATQPATGAGAPCSIGAVFEKSLSVDELRLALGFPVSRKTVYRWVREGLPAIKAGGSYYFEPSKAFPWIERRVRA